jgi:hypothetical protein
MAQTTILARRLRGLALMAISVIGTVAIVGSGGGGGLGFSDCPPGGCPPPPPPTASVLPLQSVAQVGSTVVLTVTPDIPIANASYQWQRSAGAGVSFSDMSGEVGATLRLASLSLADDGAGFRARVRGVDDLGRNVDVLSNAGFVAVSSMPPLVFEDGEFLPDDWAASVVTNPAAGGPTATEDQQTTGGNPGAYRRLTFAMPAGASWLQMSSIAQRSSYDPRSQGAIYLIDFAVDCRASREGSLFDVTLTYHQLLVEQAGRHYTSRQAFRCHDADLWRTQSAMAWRVADLVQLDGPACRAGEACPDFAATAEPLRFGYLSGAQQFAGNPAGSLVQGFDNWKVTLWRR